MKFIWPSSNSIFNSNNPNGIKLITRLRLGLSHLRRHKFRYNFLDIFIPIYSCRDDIKITIHYLLHCSNSLDERRILLDNIIIIIIIIIISKSQKSFYFVFLQIMVHQIWMLTKRFDVPPTNSRSHSRSLTFKIHICSLYKKWSFPLRISCAVIHMIGLPSTTVVHTSFNYCCYYFSLAIFNIVLFFIKWFYNEFLNFSFRKYISFQPRSICSHSKFSCLRLQVQNTGCMYVCMYVCMYTYKYTYR